MKTSLAWFLLVVLMAVSILGVAQEQEQDEEKNWYTVDAVNAGLGEPPDEVARREPAGRGAQLPGTDRTGGLIRSRPITLTSTV
ncbi:MAG: hypothetical protein U5L98_11490 [Halomonas sp.]|uniref:hypothetical protein n=1 Tax=Halomonas sp. TaxID=1486246 RepID=UPI002ACEAB38|nr:hypothetical protein [Halomonas sp.]MDZ7853238.1 hypothetical protein [Halomonas sp.]